MTALGSGVRTRRTCAALVAIGLVAFVSACNGKHGKRAQRPPPSARLTMTHPCRRPAHATCATLTVPLDHWGATRGRLRLRVAMSGRADAPRGVLVLLTGGPGQPGVPFLSRVRRRVGPEFRGYRLVMLDQRGTGAGALECPALQSAVGASDLRVPPLAAIGDCARRLGDRRRFYTTHDTVADLDMLRAALGVDRLTLDGVSYGTFTAEHYALEHPDHVARLVLDSVVPQEGIEPFQLETIRAVPRVLRSVCRESRCGTDPVADLAAVVRARHDGPALLDMLVTLSVADPTYRGVAQALHEARAGRPAGLERLIRRTQRGDRAPASILSQGLHASTVCDDYLQPWGGPSTPIPRRVAAIRRAASRLTPADVFPFDKATATGNGELVTCEHWPPVPVSPPPARGLLPGVPVLLLVGDRDLSTPLVWAQGEARRARGGNLVVVHGAGHGVHLRSHNSGGRRALARFLHQPTGPPGP